MSDNSDYKKPRINLFNLLPEVLQSDINRSVFENTFNRFLTKQETTHVVGYIGQSNPNAIRKRQIPENDVHRQAYQLQPIMNVKVGSVEHMSSWKEILNEAQRQGIDIEQIENWLNLLQFNWVPPIDIDKLINYRDYYWYDVDNLASKPQYITIRSRCQAAQARVNFYQRLIDKFGATISTTRALQSSAPEQLQIVLLDSTTDTITVSGDATEFLNDNQYFTVTSTTFNNKQFRVDGTPLYDSGTDTTLIPVQTGLIVTSENLGKVTVNQFDKLVVQGNYISLFEPGFVFFYRDSTNQELNNGYYTVVESDYNSTLKTTTITIDTTFTNEIVDGVISQEEILILAEADRNCKCYGSIGWDMTLWDDAPQTPLLWGDENANSVADLTDLINQISNDGPPSGMSTDRTLWWDTTNDKLYQYTTTNGWEIVQNSFSKIVERTVGDGYWDYTPGCGINSNVSSADQWATQNKWIHKSDVPNFAVAKQAQLPIIEYEWDLEINEWTLQQYIWKYRSDNYGKFATVDARPDLIELIPLSLWTQSSDEEIVFSELYGDLTGYFTPGRRFRAKTIGQIFQVESSTYKAGVIGQLPQTIVKMTVDVTGSGLIPVGGSVTESPTYFYPLTTSQGDSWKDYNVHWLFGGQGTIVPTVHQPINQFTSIAANATVTTATSGEYQYQFTYYAQEATILIAGTTSIDLDSTILPGAEKPLTKRARVGFNDVRVYVNGIRQYGNYDEIGDVDGYVTGINFLPGYGKKQYDIVRIEIGEATPQDFGYTEIPVRTIEDDVQFITQGSPLTTVSLIRYKKEEQVKTETNQYPLFDIYNIDGTPANKASPIFAYVTDPTGTVNSAIGLRIATKTNSTDYIFEQFLVEDDGTMYAYRDYSNQTTNYWINPITNKVMFWDGLTWSEKINQGSYYSPAIVSDRAPELPWTTINGSFWFDTINKQLKRYDTTIDQWVAVTIFTGETDPTLETIWQKGLNNETYVPAKRDWDRRTLEQYNDEKTIYIDNTVTSLMTSNSELSLVDATTQAEEMWFDSQSNNLSSNGQWVGDWEIPDPLYYNYDHENRKTVSYREVVTHFTSIIKQQEKIPAFNDALENMFHLIPINEVNYGVGGTIKEYNYGFDTFLSTLFNNTVSPIGLYEFAQDQYEILLNNLIDLFRNNAVDLLTTTSTQALNDLIGYVTDQIIARHEQNDNLNMLYGDSTTFTEVVGGTDLGLRNWIATLPYLKLVTKQQPYVNVDLDNNINQVVHHDGHRSSYFLPDASREGIIASILATPDTRNSNDTFGRQSSSLPPNNTSQFESLFASDIQGRQGVYWYHVTTTSRTLYRLELISAGTQEPATTFDPGSLWLDLTPGQEVLRVLQTDWEVVDGLTPGVTPIRLHNGTDPSDLTTATVSAWKQISLDEIAKDIIFEAETRLYQNAPDTSLLNYDFDLLQQENPQAYADFLEQAFLNYVNEREIVAPYVNDQYSATDPFTWNYKYSSPGQSYDVVQADPTTNTFKVSGNRTLTFVTNYTFYIKNSSVNDGIWTTSSTTNSTFDGTYTTIPVVGRTVNQTSDGIIYTGSLPSPYNPTTRPYNINDGSESGGFWKDLYQKIYNTPYPHMEPWKLQGYTSKPTWWDQEFLNDEPSKWGDRRWKYKHGFEIVDVNLASNYFEVDGDFTELFVSGFQFTVDSSPSVHNGTWTVDSSTFISSTNKTQIVVDETISAGTVEGRIAYAYGMWHYIRQGNIPAGRDYPNGTISVTGVPFTDASLGVDIDGLPLFDYFSVNIGNDIVTTGGTFEPDQVFPPYWDYATHFGTAVPLSLDRTIRSIYATFGEIQTPGATYIFGDTGPVEWDWRNSSQFLYDQMKIAFKLDPIRFTYNTFGPEYYNVGGLLIDKRTNKVLSHSSTVFHGDIVDNQIIKYNGTNQWYVNFGRYIGLDISLSDFRSMWTRWTAPMTYQFASFIDTPSLSIGQRYIPISEFDYRVASKHSIGVEDYWTDAFQTSILYIPPKVNRYNNENEWQFEISTSSPIGKTLHYYDIKNYQFYMDPDNDTGSLYTWEIISVDVFNDTFTIQGNHTQLFKQGFEFTVTGSVGNDGTYTTVSSAHNIVNDTTIITINESVNNLNPGGLLTANYRTLPFATGDRVVVTTRETLPVPLTSENQNGIFYYFIIIVDNKHFKLARTYRDAITGNAIDITSVGRGDHYVGQIENTFSTSNYPYFWRHYTIDKSSILQFTPPYDINGIQEVINIVDGYEAYQNDQGWVYNNEGALKDYDIPSRNVSYQLELERFIEFLFGLRSQKNFVEERYPVTVDISTNVWTFNNNIQPQFITGDPVTIVGYDSLLPTPLVKGGRYYIIRDNLINFRLAATVADAKSGTAIDITSVAGVNNIFISKAANLRKNRPQFEINPFRNAIWFRPQRGMVSNIFQGPQDDVYSSQLIFDQYGRLLGRDNVVVLREDQLTQIKIKENVYNDVERQIVINDPYKNIHLASLHVFIDTFEHVLIFNNYTSEGMLLYDPFLGLNVTKFETEFNRQTQMTQRPNAGGQYLSTLFNQGADLKRNIEASIDDLRYLYDTYRTGESNLLVQTAHKSIGYDGPKTYLDLINVNDKTQFGFWRGMIQNKGSVNSVTAYINSRRFIDAKIDEFWAYKIAEFGSASEKEYISMWLSTQDARTNELKIQFVSEDDLCRAGYDLNRFDVGCGYAYPNEQDVVSTIDNGFITVSLTDQARWFEQPNQLQPLNDNGGTMYFELKPVHKIPVTISTTEPTSPSDGDGWIDISSACNHVFSIWNSDNDLWIANGSWDPTVNEKPRLRHNMKADYVSVTLDWQPSYSQKYIIPSSATEVKDLTINGYVPFSRSLTVFKNGVQLSPDTDFVEIVSDSTDLLATKIGFTQDIAGSVIDVVYGTSKLERDYHFEEITSNIIELAYQDIIDAGVTNFNMWGWIVDKESLNPEKIIDVKSETVISPVQIWDPARNFHYYNGIHVVDLQNDNDPAVYTNTPRINQQPIPEDNFNVIYNNPWNMNEVGTTWMDTSIIDYVPYYDTKTYTNVDDRLRFWGTLADWADVKIYTWVESDIPPSEWDNVATLEEGNVSIPENQRKSGRVKQTLFEKNQFGNWVVLTNKRDRFDVSIEGTGSGNNTFTLTNIQPITSQVLVTDATANTVLIAGDYTRRITTGHPIQIFGAAGSGLPNNGDYVVSEVVEQSGNTLITVTGISATSTNDGSVKFFERVNTYINGRLDRENLLVEPSGNVTFADLREVDRVDVIQLIPTDQAFIEAEIAAGNLLREVEYTETTIYDSLNQPQTRYYFWIENKTTRKRGTLSPAEAQRTIVDIPTPYVFFQGVRDTFETTFGNTIVAREEIISVDIGDTRVTTLLPIRSISEITSNGTVISSSDYSFNVDLQEITFTTPLSTDTVTISYIGKYELPAQFPVRFVQAVIRGIRGIINDDNTYVLRWTRDFTLRDSLEPGTTFLQKKNLHEQWALIRPEQQSIIPRYLWNKVTESIVGYKLSDATIRVPSLEREFYDTENGTDTRFGLDEGQAFADKTLALQTILAFLNDPNNDFTPINIDTFFELYSFDTNSNIVEAMDVIYNTFPYKLVNKMFFEVLLDAMSTKRKYEDIFKTSYVALIGIRPFQQNGIFDD